MRDQGTGVDQTPNPNPDPDPNAESKRPETGQKRGCPAFEFVSQLVQPADNDFRLLTLKGSEKIPEHSVLGRLLELLPPRSVCMPGTLYSSRVRHSRSSSTFIELPETTKTKQNANRSRNRKTFFTTSFNPNGNNISGQRSVNNRRLSPDAPRVPQAPHLGPRHARLLLRRKRRRRYG